MSAYIIVRIKITDWDRYQAYMKLTPDIVAEFGGKFIARGGEMITLEGEPETWRVVLLEFPSIEKIKAFYASEAYQVAKSVREGAALAQFVVVEGYDPSTG